MFGQTFENAWDCDHCGLKGISALKHKTCPSCGTAARGPEYEYIADLNHPITDYADLALTKAGPDWTCRFCNTRNREDRQECTQCGEARSDGNTAVKTIDYGTTPPTTTPDNHIAGHSSTVKYLDTGNGSDWATTSADESSTPKRKLNLSLPEINWGVAKVVAVLAVIAGVAFLAFQLLHTTEVQGTVTGFGWSRVVHIDRYQTNRHEARWIPSGGRYVSQYQVVDHYNNTYRTVTTRNSRTCYRNNGNGSSSSYDCSTTSSHQELVSSIPVYATEYVYDIDEWTPFRDVNASALDRSPYWPQYTLALNGQQVIGGERVVGREEAYTVNFVDPESKETPKKNYSYNTSQLEWAQYGEQIYILKVNGFGAITNNPLQDKLASEATQTVSAKSKQ